MSKVDRDNANAASDENEDDRRTTAMPDPTTAELFERAVRLHTRRLTAIARAVAGHRVSPEDVVQQALINLYRHRDRYDWREPIGLLRRTVVNEALRVLRQPRMTPIADEDFGPAAASTAPDGAMIGRETVERVQNAIARLPDHFRAALVLCEYEQMDYAQIADVLGATVPQVKTWLHRGRRRLAEMLKEFAPAARGEASVADQAERRTVG